MSNSIRLAVGDKFTVESFKIIPSQKYPNSMSAKILCGDRVIRWTSASRIIRILEALDVNPTDIFEVYQVGEYNGYPVLSLGCNNPNTQKKIEGMFF